MYGGGYRSLEVFEEKLRNISHIAFFSNSSYLSKFVTILFPSIRFHLQEKSEHPRMLISACNITWQNMK